MANMVVVLALNLRGKERSISFQLSTHVLLKGACVNYKCQRNTTHGCKGCYEKDIYLFIVFSSYRKCKFYEKSMKLNCCITIKDNKIKQKKHEFLQKKKKFLIRY